MLKKIYEKPNAELVDFTINNRIMDAEYSEGVGGGSETSPQYPDDQ